jgi:hypothetical protein
MKRALQIVVAILSLLPLGVGTVGFIWGAGFYLPEGTATPKLDSQFRFLSAWDVGLACIVWWIIPRIELQTSLFRIVCLAVFFGGVGRVVAWFITGWPGPAFLAVTLIELLVPLLIPWQAYVARQVSLPTGDTSDSKETAI